MWQFSYYLAFSFSVLCYVELEFWFPVLSRENQKLMYNIVEDG